MARITRIIDSAGIELFRPLIYLIPSELVKERILQVSVDDAANPLSTEYQVLDLESHEFEIIQPLN